ncbi:MAG: glycosyltransferase family 39 protein [Bacteroidota bacterium]|nr:glycosyltransferase family 39 protein [Bacteroidota bacterium]MDP4228916.1 glycosyltransferase family 39 protein [Bacteroidota bacterium]MDP4235306.1 glycosyltransferase family 39 protein [Bacteroidota bacterium]
MKNIFLILSEWIFSSAQKRFVVGITVVALGIRLAIIIFAGNPQHPQLYEHGEIAHNLYTGHGFAMHWPYPPLDPARAAVQKEPPQYQGAFMPPINPYQIYCAYLVFGESATAITILMLLSAVYSSLAPIVVYSTAKLFSSENASRSSALIAVFFLPAAFAVTTFSGSSLYQLVILLTLLLAVRSVLQPSYRHFILFGILAGVMTLLRSEFYAVGFILIAVAGVMAWRSDKIKITWKYAAAGVIMMTAITAPWSIRNYDLFGKFIPIVDHPWHEIWRGNNIYASGSTYDASGNSVWENASQYPAIIRALDSLPYDQQFDLRADSIFHGEAIEFIKAHPAKFAELGAIKLFSLMTIDYHYAPTRNVLYLILMMMVILPSVFGAITLVRNSRQSKDYRVAFVYGTFFFYYCGIIVITFILPRYQIYIFSAFLPLTGMGISSLRDKLRSAKKGQAG